MIMNFKCGLLSPEDVVLDEERIGAGLEDKVLHEGLRDVVISLNNENFSSQVRKVGRKFKKHNRRDTMKTG
jgi:hypothetical protein